jgi:hypothetical protein
MVARSGFAEDGAGDKKTSSAKVLPRPFVRHPVLGRGRPGVPRNSIDTLLGRRHARPCPLCHPPRPHLVGRARGSGCLIVAELLRIIDSSRSESGAGLGYRSFDTAGRTLQGVEAVNMIRKGQVKRLDRSDTTGQAKFVVNLFQVAASARSTSKTSASLTNICNGTR